MRVIIDGVVGRLDGGRIRILHAPLRNQPHTDAASSILVSWCRANGLDPDRIPESRAIEIRENPCEHGHYEIHWFELPQDPTPAQGWYEGGPMVPRRGPLRVEPQGILDDELTCGHVLPSDTGDAMVCAEDIDPATYQHPGDHRTADRTAGWRNHHPGTQAFRAGLPHAGDLAPAAAHALVLARLQLVADRRPRVNRRQALIALDQHVNGLRELAGRHQPRETGQHGTVCEHDYVTGAGLTTWPCTDYRQALAGIVVF